MSKRHCWRVLPFENWGKCIRWPDRRPPESCCFLGRRPPRWTRGSRSTVWESKSCSSKFVRWTERPASRTRSSRSRCSITWDLLWMVSVRWFAPACQRVRQASTTVLLLRPWFLRCHRSSCSSRWQRGRELEEQRHDSCFGKWQVEVASSPHSLNTPLTDSEKQIARTLFVWSLSGQPMQRWRRLFDMFVSDFPQMNQCRL